MNTQIARLLTILRGLLAEPSGCPDDPWQRVIFKPCAPSSGASDAAIADAAIDLGDVVSKAADDELRGQLRIILQRSAVKPDRVIVTGGNAYRIERGVVSTQAPLQNKIALVTGAAGAIGAGICRGLLAKGTYVAAADLAREALDNLVRELNPDSLRGRDRDRIMGVTMDVTDAASVAAGFDAVAEAWGGVDIIVVNAGIAMVAPLVELDMEAFRRLERVNVEGTLLTLAEAGRRLCRQATGGDMILVSTKNVFAPGAQFGAYSATKAAAHQLARIASLELASFDIRVNMVAPDAVFSDGERKSGLWAEVGPSRMKARGLDEKGLEDYYRNRNLLKARVTPDHVANAVLFFAARQTPTTGATIPVDGGLPDATPR
ncbi:MAG: SDR family NAD(P)-dependent oxidoreductase [Verrucomicrobia bacterium]|nr:SDR family NAD(P)-dependent oxidoreductase [Verrucomicrobiota bacterium]MBU1734749.1 SDR family NAD(P)-dependent oxidoreductase [Verrucomicrobiota bacterium]MBU1857768.1 SDR family NAD(P)-dependent oxidoreductase [Verrucomicrobiota bacterium]